MYSSNNYRQSYVGIFLRRIHGGVFCKRDQRIRDRSRRTWIKGDTCRDGFIDKHTEFIIRECQIITVREFPVLVTRTLRGYDFPLFITVGMLSWKTLPDRSPLCLIIIE